MLNIFKKILLFYFLVLIFIFTIPLYAQRARIAVMDFQSKGVPKTLAQNVSELIRGEMINSAKYIVIERSQMKKIIKEQGLQQSGCTDVTCAVKMGKILTAQKIIIGSVMKMGGMIIITGRVVDVKKGVGEVSASQQAKSEAVLFNAVENFTAKLTGGKIKNIIQSNSTATVKTEKDTYRANEKIVVIFSNLPGNKSDWITVVKASEPPEMYIECPYTNGQKNGRMIFKGLPAGDYEVRVYYDWDNNGEYNIRLRYPFKIK